jgi:hypothetical protein
MSQDMLDNQTPVLMTVSRPAMGSRDRETPSYEDAASQDEAEQEGDGGDYSGLNIRDDIYDADD